LVWIKKACGFFVYVGDVFSQQPLLNPLVRPSWGAICLGNRKESLLMFLTPSLLSMIGLTKKRAIRDR